MTRNRSIEVERDPFDLAILVWENEGGAPDRDCADHHYGRRIEMNRSWTVYHVFTGSPARIGGTAMTGLSRSNATASMLSLNLRNAERRHARVRLPAGKNQEIAECQS